MFMPLWESILFASSYPIISNTLRYQANLKAYRTCLPVLQMGILLRVVLVLACVTYVAQGRSNGAPEQACANMVPQHTSSLPRMTRSPFEPTLDP